MAHLDQQTPKNLRLKFSKIYSVGKLFKISIHLKIEPAAHNFEIKSKSKPPKSNFFSWSNPAKSLKKLRFRFSGMFNKFLRRRPRKNYLFERRRNGLMRLWLWWAVLFLFLVLVLVFVFSGLCNRFFWKCVWNLSPSPRFLYQFSKVIFNSMGFEGL